MKCFLALTLALTLTAQDRQFGVQSRLVLVPVAVTDAKGHIVEGLEMKDFIVLDNGRPQKATVDTGATGVAPIALIVAIQASGISRAVLEKVNKIGAMIQPLVTGDRGCAGVVSFSENITWLQECTADEDAISRAFDNIRSGAPKSGRMLDAVSEAIQRLEKRRNARRVLLLISESRDRGSDVELDKVAIAAQTAGVTVYAATYSAFATAFTTKSSATAEPQAHKRPNKPSDETGTVTGSANPSCNPNGCTDPPLPLVEQRVDLLGGIGELVRLGKENTAQALTQGTGGAIFPFTRLKGLEDAIQKLSGELHSQYVLSFVPDDPTPGYHHIEVRVTTGDYRIRARPGYWSTQGASQ